MIHKTEQSFDNKQTPSGLDEAGRGTFDERLNKILEAATHVMARQGYEGASMRAVAKAADVSLAGLYHYFENKERMLFLIQFRAFSSLVSNLRERLLDITDPQEQIRIMIRSHVMYFAANMPALKVCSHELDSLTGEGFKQVRILRHEYYDMVRTMVDGVLDQKGNPAGLDHHVATMSLFGMLNWLYRWYSPADDRSPSGLANILASQFLSGLAVGVGETASEEVEGA